MSFSFRNLFSQDKPTEAPDASVSGDAADWASGKSKKEEPAASANPFSSAPFSNVFSNAEASAASESPAPVEPVSKPFVPTPLPTHRGTFEALFAGQGIGTVAPASPGMVGRYTLREILPFLPPSMVAQGHLDLDRSVDVPLPANGSGEVKLSVIQGVCPEIFATEITPLNDSELVLPKSVSGTAPGAEPWKPKGVATPPGPMERPIAVESIQPGLGAGRPPVFASAEVRTPAPAMAVAAAASNPFAAPMAASTAPAARTIGVPIGNPFSASATELATQPAAVKPAAEPVAASPFGFPDPKEAASPFGAFGAPPAPASTPVKPDALQAGPWSGGDAGSAPAFGIDLGFGKSDPFASPENVSLTPNSAPDPWAKPDEKPVSHSLPWAVQPEKADAGATSPFGGPQTVPGSNPFDAFPESKALDNPFAPPAEKSEAPKTPEASPAASWPFGESWTPLGEAKPRPVADVEPVKAEIPEPVKASEPIQSGGFSLPESFFERAVAKTPAVAEPAPNFDFSAAWAAPKAEKAAPPVPVSESAAEPKPTEDKPAAKEAGMPFVWPDLGGAAAKPSSSFDAPVEAAPEPVIAPEAAPEPVAKVETEVKAESLPMAEPAGKTEPAAPFDFSFPWGPLEAPKKPEAPLPEPAVATGDTVVFTLGELLRPVAAGAGLDLKAIPQQAKVRLPISLIEPQLATGSVSVTVRDLVRHAAAEEVRALESVDPGLLVTLPENELYHQLSDFAPDLVFGSDEDLEAQFSTLFGAEARADSGIGWETEILEDDPAIEFEVSKDEPLAAAAELPAAVEPEPIPEPEPKQIESVEPVAAEPQGFSIEGKLPVPEATVPLPKKATPVVLPVATARTGKKPVDIAATVTPPAPFSQPNPKVSDPFAPLPRRKPAEPAVAKQVEPPASSLAAETEESETSFFDDLDLFSTPISQQALDEGEDDAMDDMGDEPGSAFPASDDSHWGFSGFSTLEDLEPAKPVAKASAAKAAASKAPKISVSIQKNPKTPVAQEPVSAGFFDELETATRKPEVKITNEPAVLPEPVAVQPEPVVAPVQPEPVPVAVQPLPVVAPIPPAPVVETAPPAPVPVAAAPQVLPTVLFQTPAAPAASAGQEIASGQPRDIELRAVFGTNEAFTFLRVADLTAGLPGISACSIIAPGCTAQAPRGPESGNLAVQADALLKGVREIARATGMTNAETFTLHTDQGLISVFLHGDYCLTVRHQMGQFDPGVREKLILVTRGLAGLAG